MRVRRRKTTWKRKMTVRMKMTVRRKRMPVVRKIVKLKSSAAPIIRSAIGYWLIICIV